MQVRQQQHRYAVSILENTGFDMDYPAGQWPLVVFIRDIENPIGSAWSFHQTEAEAEKFRRECEASIAHSCGLGCGGAA